MARGRRQRLRGYVRSLTRRFVPAILTAALAVVLSGCFSAFDAPRPRSRSAVAPVRAGPGEYLVVAGDTLYGIAFRNQLDYHELAAWNRIRGPDYRIYPGRVLRLTSPDGSIASRAPRPAESGPTAAVADPAEAAPPESVPDPGGPVAVAQSQVRTASATPPARPSLGDAQGWRWPTQGQVVRAFGVDGSKGVDVGGTSGQVVVAAAPGKVVYSGAALKGYGELIIVKHDERYLSAYGYNRRRLVSEGEIVAAGQPIAELGTGPQQTPELHFEIRDQGRPVDPLALLPPHGG